VLAFEFPHHILARGSDFWQRNLGFSEGRNDGKLDQLKVGETLAILFLR
jgi:hypothetical protein